MNQREVSEILFHFHLDQAAANLQVMHDSLGFSREARQDFNAAHKTINRLWSRQQRIVAPKWDDYEELAISLGECMQEFLKAKNYKAMLTTMKQINSEP